MCNICGHESLHHSNLGCDFTTCSCEGFKGKTFEEVENNNNSEKSPTQNVREKLDAWDLNTQAFKSSPPMNTKQESQIHKQVSPSEKWDEFEKNWKIIDELMADDKYEEANNELDFILGKNFENITVWVTKGHVCFNLKKYDEALIYYGNALILDKQDDKKLNKGNHEILFFLAKTHNRNGDDEKSIEFLKHTLAIKEDFIPALDLLGILYRDSEKIDLAIEQFKKILNIEKNNVDAYDHLGYCYELEEKWDESIEYFNKSKHMEGKDESDIYSDIHLAHCYLNKKDLEHAEQLINNQKILENETQYSLQIRAEIYEAQGRIEDSLYAYQKELSSYSGNRSGVWFDLGFLYDKIGEPILSLEYYKRFVELESLTSNVAQNMGLVLSSIGKDEEAIKLFDTALKKDPKNLALLKNQSRFYKNLKQFDNAMKFIDKAMKIEPKNPWVLHQKALLLMEIGELSDSLQIFKSIQSMPELKDDAPSKELILNNIGWNHIKNNDNEKGLEYIEQALKINSTKPYILDSKAVALYNLGRYKESKKSYEEKFELTGNEKDRLWIIDCLIRLAKECERGSVDEKKYYEEALEIINLNLKTYASPDNLTFYYKGIVYLQLKKYEEAHKFQMIVIKNDPLDSYAWDELGDISNLNGNPSQALIYFKKSTELEPRFYNCKEYAKCLSIVENYDDALFWIDQSIKFESTVEVYNYKGNIFYKMKKYSDALNCYEEALKIESNDGLVLQNKANLLRTIGKYEEAIKFFNMSIAVKSTFDNNIRKILTYIDWKKFEKALDLCNQALVKFPDDSVEILERMIGIFRNMKNQNMVKEYKEKLQKLKDLK